MADMHYEELKLLLKASSKDFVNRLCNEAFLYRNSHCPDTVVKKAAEGLKVEPAEAAQLLASLGTFTKKALFLGSTEPSDLLTLFPANFHKNLRDLLAKIVIENMTNWKNQAIDNQVSLPRLIDFDWRVDIKTSSDSIARMAVPTCILQLKVQDAPSQVGSVPEVSSLNVELPKETLETMLDGLGKIRDQLSSVAKKA